jgi:hypothetical protein
MKSWKRLMRLFLLLTWLILPAFAQSPHALPAKPQSTTGLLITDDDVAGTHVNSATFFTVAANGTLSTPTLLNLGGHGTGGGFFAANRVNILNSATSSCAYFSAGVSNTIAGVQLSTQIVSGNFSASATDNGADNGIGMVMNNSYLYASFSTSGTIATFAVQSGCQLQFLSDISPSGLNGGVAKGMALYGNLMVVTYGDGSIESFDISGGVPVSNGDQQNASGFASDDYPDGVDITSDGHYAIFGDASSDAAVEVSDISSGHLTQTVFYSLPVAGFNSNNVRLSPDGTLLYITNNSSGQVTAAFFNASTGTVSGGCVSAQLNGFDDTFSFLGGPVTQFSTGTGSVLYLAEFGQPSAIAILNVTSNGAACTLTEAASSPVSEPNSANLVSLGIVQAAQSGLYSPPSGSTLSGSSVTFQWASDPTATAFWIDVGSTAGSHNYYSSGSLSTTTLSATVSGLPTNGSTIYVTFYSLIGGSWNSIPYTFTAFNATAGAGVLTTPPPSSTLSGSSVTFGWTAGSNATAYWLDIGNVAGGHSYYSSGNLGNTLSTTANGLPTDGSAVYVTLYSLIGGVWTPNAYSYTAFNLSAASGVLTTPAPGSVLTGSTVTFGWNAGSGASAYWLDVGSTAGAHNYYSSGNLGNVLSKTVSGLPTDGSAVYVTLYSLIGSQWMGSTYNFTALNSTSGLAVMQTPIPGSTLSGTTATFTWSSDTNASAYWVDISAVAAGHNDLDSSGNLGNVLTETVHNLPANNTTIYVTLYSYVGGQWLSTASTYKSGP